MVTGSLVKRGQIWYAVWHQDGKQRWKSTGERNRAKAKEVLAAQVAPLNSGNQARAFREAADAACLRQGETYGMTIRLHDIWPTFNTAPERPDAGQITIDEYHRIWSRFVEWCQFSQKRTNTIADITPHVAADFAADLRTRIGSATYNKNIGVFRLIWKTINKRTGWRENPWMAVALRRSQPVSKRELTLDELDRLAKACSGEWRVLIALGSYTGLRLADCATLQWGEVELAMGVIRRVPRKTARKTGKLVTVPIHRGLAPILEAQRKACKKDGDVLPTLAARYRHNYSALDKHLARIFTRAGIERMAAEIPAGRVRRPVLAGFHSLRHTFVSICRNAGVPEAFVMNIVGHSNPAMTRHYTHIGEGAARDAIDALPEIGGPQAETARGPLPQWATAELAGMTAESWEQVRDRMLAAGQPPRLIAASSSSQPAQNSAPPMKPSTPTRA